MQKIFAIILIAVFAVGCTGSRGCGCPSWGFTPTEIHPDHPETATALHSNDFVWD